MNAAPQMHAVASGGALQAAARRVTVPQAPPGDDALPSFSTQFAEARRAGPEAEERDAHLASADLAAPTTSPPAPAVGAGADPPPSLGGPPGGSS